MMLFRQTFALIGLSILFQACPCALVVTWDANERLSSGAASERTGDVPAGISDIAAIRAVVAPDALYLLITCAQQPEVGHAWGFCVLLDTDLNRRSGFVSGALGADYLAQVPGNLGGDLLLHRRHPGNDSADFQGWEPQAVVHDSVRVSDASSRFPSNSIEIKIPWDALGIADPKQAALRFRVCESSPDLTPDQGDWAPDLAEGFFSIGEDPRALSKLPNSLSNGDFEALNTALASQMATGWGVYQAGPQTSVATLDRSFGKATINHALQITSADGQSAGANGTPIAARRGVVTFHYKIDASDAEGRNLGMQVIGLTGEFGREGYRFNWSPPAEHVGDNQWHEGSFDFRLPANLSHALIVTRVNEGTPGSGAADWMIDDIQVFVVPEGISVNIANFVMDDPLLTVGEETWAVAYIENAGAEPLQGFTASLKVEGSAKATGLEQPLPTIEAGGFTRCAWALKADEAGTFSLQVTLEANQTSADDIGEGTRTAETKGLAIEKGKPVDRTTINTDEQGYWRELRRPTTFQAGNGTGLKEIEHKQSKDLGRNTYGVCMQLPRTRDYEHPFAAEHLIDDDPVTCWSSMQRNHEFPKQAPRVTITLPKAMVLSEVKLVPYWSNSDFPRGFRVEGISGSEHQPYIEVQSHDLAQGSEMRGDKFVQSFGLTTGLTQPVACSQFIITFDRLPSAGGNYAEVSSGWKARLSGLELIDEHGENVALASKGATIEASDTFTGWQNRAENIEKAYQQIFEIGLKWVRIGQWGDQTEWAAVEREKGVYKMDPRTDEAIDEIAVNGVDILYGLQYGNHLYNDVNENPEDKPWQDIGPIFNEGSPFNRNNGPRTAEARAAFVRYVDWVVRNYKDKVKYWELWNEQNGWYPDNEPDYYGMLLAEVGKKIKEIDPTAKFSYGGTAAPAPITTEIALRHGGAPYIDITAFHPYGITKPEGGMGTNEAYQGKPLSQNEEQTGWHTLEDIIAGVRKPFAEHGRPDVEVWMNEFGGNVSGLDYVYNPGISEYASAKQIMRLYVYGGWNNSRVAWWALHTDNKSQDWGILDPETFELRPMALAMRNVCSTLSDVTPIREPIARLKTDAGAIADPKCISFARDGSGEVLTAVWAADPIDGKVKDYRGDLEQDCAERPTGVTITDLYWGESQQAHWDWNEGKLRVSGLRLKDYPIVISVK